MRQKETPLEPVLDDAVKVFAGIYYNVDGKKALCRGDTTVAGLKMVKRAKTIRHILNGRVTNAKK